ncbi:MAG: hypothetical protein U1E53_05595 [Dongiaceae bacterium]
MRARRLAGLARALAAAALLLLAAILPAAAQSALQQQNEALFAELQRAHRLTDSQMARIRAIFAASGYVGQGNPAVTQHPMTPQQCLQRLQAAGQEFPDPEFTRICGAPYMAPLYDPANQRPTDARACIDQFEYPDMPCTYPVVWVKAREAEEICEAEGKRLCDAHEWEGACAGALLPPDYDFSLTRGADLSTAAGRLRAAHNRQFALDKNWSYGPEYRTGICGTSSFKTAGCNGGEWPTCGSNTFPTGSFPACHSQLWVYDLNGNAAEHMNLPLNESQMTSRGSTTLGVTEMKGSWFIFDTYRAHEDWCRWRAPFWHGTRVMDGHSHANYHLSFRCCKTVGGGTEDQ